MIEVILATTYYGGLAFSCWKIFAYFHRSFFESLEPGEAWRRQAIAVVALVVAGVLVGFSWKLGPLEAQWLAGIALCGVALVAFAVVSVAGLFLFTRVGIEN
jgi:hypothetical protein